LADGFGQCLSLLSSGAATFPEGQPPHVPGAGSAGLLAGCAGLLNPASQVQDQVTGAGSFGHGFGVLLLVSKLTHESALILGIHD
jgi:hypothetical protein